MLTKSRKLISFDKLDNTLKRQLLKEYPDGFEDVAIRIDAPTPFYAVLLEADSTTYLVKLSNYIINMDADDLDDELDDDVEGSEDLEDMEDDDE